MFDHDLFDNYKFNNIPLDQDLFIVDEIYMNEYEQLMLRHFGGADYEYIPAVSFVAVRIINDNSLELSWYANYSDRFHEISVNLPREQFVFCVGSRNCDEKPHIFVKSKWVKNIHLRSYSIFAMIDAIDVKVALRNGKITREKLIELRSEIDFLSEDNLDVSFISFADSLLLKSNWSVGDVTVPTNYNPETFIYLAKKINAIYQDILGLNTYAVIAQGSNEYYDDPLLHISTSKNHISLNSLGIPFAQLLDIETTAKKAKKNGAHPPSELYMDEQYYHSLKFRSGFDKNKMPDNSYKSKITNLSCKYYYSSVSNIVNNLDAVSR